MIGTESRCASCGAAISQVGRARVWVHDSQFHRVFDHAPAPRSIGLAGPRARLVAVRRAA